MINFDIDITQFNEHTWLNLERDIKDNTQAQKDMRANLYCMWFPNTKEATTIARLALHDIDLTCDKIVDSVTLNNSVNKEYAIRNAFEQMHKKLATFDIRFDDEYIDLKVDEVGIQYHLLWAKQIAKDIERDQKEIIKQQAKEEKQLQKDKEKAERELSQLQYDYARRVQLKREKEELDELQKQIDEYQRKIKQLDYSLAHVRAGYVYVVSNDAYSDERYKVGITRREVPQRMKELSNAAIPFEMNINGYVYCDDVFDVETKVHNYLDQYRVNKVNKHREWFACGLDTIKEAFKAACGIDIVLKEVHDDEYLYGKGK